MARVLPFRALLHDPSHSAVPAPWAAEAPLGEAQRRAMLSEPSHGLQLAEAFDVRGALAAGLSAGRLRREAKPGYHLLEVQSERPREAPVHFIFGLLPPQEGLQPLEEGRTASPAPLVIPTPAVAADDHRALLDLLGEILPECEVQLEGELGEGRRFRLLREERPASLRRLQAVLEEAPLRPLGPLVEGSPHLVAVLPLSSPGWRFRSIHRAVKGLTTFESERFLQLVAEYARVLPLDVRLDTERGQAEARERLGTLSRGSHAVLLVLPGMRAHLLRYREGLEFPKLPAVPRSPTLRSLDLALLNALVFRTVLGIREPEKVGHPHVFTVPSIDALVRDVEAGIFQAGFALNPPPTWEVRAVMEAGCSLPPRTLRIDPSPPAGLLYGDPEGPR